MADEKKEMDEYSVPVINRLAFFRFKVFGGWGIAGILLTLLIRCFNTKEKVVTISAEEKMNIYKEATKQAKLDMKEDFEYAMRVLDQKDKDATRKLDSIKSKL